MIDRLDEGAWRAVARWRVDGLVRRVISTDYWQTYPTGPTLCWVVPIPDLTRTLDTNYYVLCKLAKLWTLSVTVP
jgi:hypothetical protein